MAFTLPYLSMSRLGVLEVFEQPTHMPHFSAMPQRKLAMQIGEVCRHLSEALGSAGYPAQCVFGGVPKGDQRMAFGSEGVNMLVATPGRLQDLGEEESLDYPTCGTWCWVRPTDRMLVDWHGVNTETQPDLHVQRDLAMQLLKEPVHVGMSSVGAGLVAKTSIRQEFEALHNDNDKIGRLLHILKAHFAPDKNITFFGLYKKETAWLESFLKEKGYLQACALQDDMLQNARTQAIAGFMACKNTTLIAELTAPLG